MGNSFSPSSNTTAPPTARLVLWGGATRTVTTNLPTIVGEILHEFPDHLLCHGDSFYVGYHIPSLSGEDQLLPGETYFLIPAKRLQRKVLSTASIAELSSAAGKGRPAMPFEGVEVFEHVRTKKGAVLMRVSAKYLERISMLGGEGECRTMAAVGRDGMSEICGEREEYVEVGGLRKKRRWSPKLETISECKPRCWRLSLRFFSLNNRCGRN